MCNPSLVFAILEVLTILRKACENEHLDEVRTMTFILLRADELYQLTVSLVF